VSMLDHTLKPELEPVRRLEVITGTVRRRRFFSDDDKARIVEETLAPGAVVSEVARRHGLSPQQQFGWRRQARRPVVTSADAEVPRFVPAVVEAQLPERTVHRQRRGPRRQPDRTCGIIEVEIDGVTVRVGRGAEAKTVAAVLRAAVAPLQSIALAVLAPQRSLDREYAEPLTVSLWNFLPINTGGIGRLKIDNLHSSSYNFASHLHLPHWRK
jgi:transposase